MPSAAQSDASLRLPTHAEFVSQWFPRGANSATHLDIARSSRLATIVESTPSQFGVAKRTLELIRSYVGFDPSQVERVTSATITVGVPGTIIFFTLDESILLEDHFSSGQFPITPERHRFHNRQVYRLASAERTLGLYSAEGKHFVLGDWSAFKNTLLGNDGHLNELAKILDSVSAPIIICSNPRRASAHFSKDDPFGTVISLDFEDDNLAFQMQEEQPSPAMASTRLKQMEAEMPAAFAQAYGLETKKGVRYRSVADGRRVVFATHAPIAVASKLLSYLLGSPVTNDRQAQALASAEDAITLYKAADAAGVSTTALQSPESIIAALCVGLESKDGKRFALPFLTGVEQVRVAAQLQLESGQLVLSPELEVPSGPTLKEKAIRRLAQRIAVLTMSAAAADSPELKELKTPEEIVAAICSTGFNGGDGYASEIFKTGELTEDECERVSTYLEMHRGYLIYKPD